MHFFRLWHYPHTIPKWVIIVSLHVVSALLNRSNYFPMYVTRLNVQSLSSLLLQCCRNRSQWAVCVEIQSAEGATIGATAVITQIFACIPRSLPTRPKLKKETTPRAHEYIHIAAIAAVCVYSPIGSAKLGACRRSTGSTAAKIDRRLYIKIPIDLGVRRGLLLLPLRWPE